MKLVEFANSIGTDEEIHDESSSASTLLSSIYSKLSTGKLVSILFKGDKSMSINRREIIKEMSFQVSS